jgi:DNA-binding response OmpR family regulator
MKRRTILLIDSDRSTRRQRVCMLLTHGYLVHAAERVEDLDLPFNRPAPDLVLLRVDEPPDRSNSAYEQIRKAAPGQRIGFLLDDRHRLCQVFVNDVLTRPREELAGDLIQAVAAMFEMQPAAQHAALGN